MNNYKKFELTIFNWLKSKNEADSNFTFSVRQKANKGAELNYFIGTETSKYFSTTFWNIPVAYPGSASDLINLVFGFDNKNNLVYTTQFIQTKNPETEQNELALELIKNCKTGLKPMFDRFYENDSSKKMEFFRINGKSSYTSIEQLIIDANDDIEKIIPIVDIEIKKLRLKHPTFRAHRFSIQEQTKMFDKMEIRFKTHQGSTNQIILIDDTEDNGLLELKLSCAFPLNQILYGPPGTGKTYNTINKAISIINPDFDLNQNREVIKIEYEKLVADKQILFTTFHQNMSYEDFIEGIKPELTDDNDPILKYKMEAGIFKIACINASYLCYKKYQETKNKLTKYTFDNLYDAFIEHIQTLLDEGNPPVYKTLTGKDVTVIEINSNNSIKARAKNSIATRYPAPLTKENLQKLYDRFNSINEINNLKQIKETVEITPRITEFYAVFNALKDFEKNDFKPDSDSSNEISAIDGYDLIEVGKKFKAGVYKNAIKDFGKIAEPIVLIIDEINRGNVSQIFGELITLLEEDKRLGKHEALEVLLPYSKDKFGVPPNLYIIGTMNTADRSVEALDTALRRRFCFEEMMPKYNDLLEIQFSEFNLGELLNKINDRIEILLDRDHIIGHSYFIRLKANDFEGLKMIFKNNIIPLLQEYFYGDYEKIGMVIGKAFFEDSKKYDKNIFAPFNTQQYPENGTILRMKSIDENFDIINAVKTLLNKKTETTTIINE